MKGKKNSIFSGAVALGIGTFFAKILGAMYRIPLTKILGGTGIGLYQMVFPVYAVLLDFSGAGAPSALSKLISSYTGEDKFNYAYNYLKLSLKFFCIFGLTCFAVMAFFSKSFAIKQGNGSAYISYVFLSPAILLVCLISPLRGYFQGLMNMKPTAVSQIIEQAIKLIFGLFFARLFLPNIPLAVAGATLSITISELFALLYMYITYKKHRKTVNFVVNYGKLDKKIMLKNLIKTVIPITLIGIIMPLSNVVDSFITINLLSKYLTDATALYGLLSGVAMTVINLPVAICYGVAVVAIPAVSGARNKESKRKNVKKTFILTLAFSIPCAIACFLFSDLAVNILFRSLPLEQKTVASNLIKILSPTVVLLSVLQTQNAVLIGSGKLYTPMISMGVGVSIKIMLEYALLKRPAINIYGGAIAVIACYFTANLLNLFTMFHQRERYDSKAVVNRS